MKPRNYGYIVFCLVLIIWSFGCVGTKVHTLPVRTFNSTYDNVWDSTVKFLTKEDEPVIILDKEKGFISTDWIILEKVFATKRYRYDIQITKLNDSQIQVAVSSPQESYDMGDWEPMLPSERRSNAMFNYIKNSVKTTTMVKEQGSNITIEKSQNKKPFNKVQRGIKRGQE